jgi:TonB-linked SusC/RagA family outer membrane protein
MMGYAQSRTVSGVIKDEKGEIVPFATIMETGTRNAVPANSDGTFTIKIGQNSTLTISGSGFTTQKVAPGTGFVTVSLARTENLQEVVVTALGIRRKPEEIGYSAARVTQEQITSGHNFNLAQSLSGKVSGLTISNTSASVNATPRIVLRGLRSITGDNTALIVLDGVPVPQNTISYINPNDVERIDVLKGGQAATLFGSDGVNGAIVITTKKGGRRPEVTLTHSSNVEKLAFLPKNQTEFGSGSAYGDNKEENFHSSENQQYGPAYDGTIRGLGRVLADGSSQAYPYAAIPDAREKIWNTGYTAQTDISYRAGDESSNFYASYQNVHTNGIVPGDKYNRNSLRMNAGRSYGRLKLTFDATYTFDYAPRTNSDFYFFALNTSTWVPLDQFKDWRTNKFADPSGYYNDYYNNPWWQLDNNRFNTKNNYFNGNATANFKASKSIDLTLRIAAATTNTYTETPSDFYAYNAWSKTGAYVNNFNLDYDTYLTGRGRFIAKSTPINGSYGDAVSFGNRLNSDLFGTYTKQFKNISLRVVLGNNIQVKTSKSISTGVGSIAIPGLFNANNSQNGILTGGDSKSEIRKVGNYADVTFGYKGLAYLHGTYRYDVSSVFYDDNRDKHLYQFQYPGVDASFIITDIIPSLKSKILSYLKLRASWNRNGNDNLGAYQLKTVYTSASGFPYSGLLGTTQGNTVYDPNLKPEQVSTTEFGIETQFWNGRVSFEAAYYRQLAVQQILAVSISSSTGFTTYQLNAADVTNRGFELDGKVNIFKNKNWNVNISANYSYNTNRVNSLNASTGLNSNVFQNNGLFTLNAEVGQMFPYLKTTTWLRDSVTGKIVIDPTDGWPVKATATTGQGSTTPKDNLGIGINVTYKNFTFAADMEYRGGFIVYHNLAETMTFTGASALTTLYHREPYLWPNSVYLDPVSNKYVPNTNIAINNWMAIYYGLGDLSNGRSFPNVGEINYSSGDFWKLRDISLGYDLPAKVMSHIKAIRGISITVWARNLKTWLAPDNYFTDPEFSNTSGNSQGINTTLNTPPTKQIGGTLRFTF